MKQYNLPGSHARQLDPVMGLPNPNPRTWFLRFAEAAAGLGNAPSPSTSMRRLVPYPLNLVRFLLPDRNIAAGPRAGFECRYDPRITCGTLLTVQGRRWNRCSLIQ